MVKTWSSSARGVCLIPGQELRSHVPCRQKTKNRSNIVTNSRKTVKVIHIKHILKKGILKSQQKENEQLNFLKWATDLNRHLTQKDVQMANKHMKRCSVPRVLREMQTRTARCHSARGWPQSRTLTTPNAGKERRQPQFPFIAGEDEKGPATLENNIAVYYKLSTPNQQSHYLAFTQRAENPCAQKNLYRDAFACVLVPESCPTLCDPRGL